MLQKGAIPRKLNPRKPFYLAARWTAGRLAADAELLLGRGRCPLRHFRENLYTRNIPAILPTRIATPYLLICQVELFRPPYTRQLSGNSLPTMVVSNELPANFQATRQQLVAYNTCTLTLRPPYTRQLSGNLLPTMVVGNELPANFQATRKQLVAYNTCTLTLKWWLKCFVCY